MRNRGRFAALLGLALLQGCGSDGRLLSLSPHDFADTPAEVNEDASRPERVGAERTLSIEEAMREALEAHPRIAAAAAEQDAAASRVDEARFGYMPALGVSGEINRSTSNNMQSTFFPAQGFPAISGTTTTKSIDEPSSWQTGVSLWATWDALSFARQAAAVDVALAERHAKDARVNVEHLDVAYRAADAFLLLLEAEEAVRAARAGVQRAQALVDMTRPLVEQTLRPGVDLARAEAELAAARTAVAQAEMTRESRRTALAVAMGRADARVEIEPGKLLEPIDSLTPKRLSARSNPSITEANATAERAGATGDVARMEFLPRVDLVAALFARGSGKSPTATAEGLVPDTANWAAGLVITWSILDMPRLAARADAADGDYVAAIARRDQVVLEVSGQLRTASVVLDGAMRVAKETPLAYESARLAQEQAYARYQSSLAPLVDVADAHRVLAQADAANAIARIEVRRALLLLARASGDLGPFLSRL
ncbi:MAG: TolC family protein [Polyangiaceae bacterium]|nr:TolC family protein [Polyangiaceae bacterium]